MACRSWERLTQPELLATRTGGTPTALPFAPADLRRDSIAQAWNAYREAWRSPRVREFIERCRNDPALLRHANETW